MPTNVGSDAVAMLPEILVFVGGLLVLVGGSFLPRERQWLSRLVTGIVLVGAVAVSVWGLSQGERMVFSSSFAVDTATGVARVIALVATLLVVLMASDEFAGHPRESETYALLLFATAGVTVLAGASDLMLLAVGFLLASIPLYGLIGLLRLPGSAEAALKTYLMGALFGIVLLFGVTILYGVAGETTYVRLDERLSGAPQAAVTVGVVAVLAGLMFKAGAVPAHFWVPDAAQGTSGTAAAFLTTVPKIGALVAAYRLVSALPDTVAWPLLIAVLAVASMTLGNLAAYTQSDPRRLLGWSTVSQVGYLLVPVAVAGRSDLALPSLLLYLAGYTTTNIAAFAVTTAVPQRRDLASYRGMSRSSPWLAAALLVALLGLLGTPPTAVVVGKLTTATAAWDGGQQWLAVAVLANTLVSLFYYLRWIIPVYRPGAAGERLAPGSFAPLPWSSSVAVVAAALSVVIGLGAGLLLPLFAGAALA
ncbi:MAG: proton-conducting transporter membrane subunit [Nocardioidaceae bacterium]